MAGVAAPTGTNSTSKEEEPTESMHAAKVQAYLSKIKEFQKLKKQKWDPLVEDDLAHKLVMVDDLLAMSPEEKEIEHKLRSEGPKNMRVEMDLGREKIEAKMKQTQAEARARMKKKEVAQKAAQAKAYSEEQKAIQKQIKKYKILAIPTELAKNYKNAATEYKAALTAEDSAKKTPEFEAFSQQHHLNRNVENNPDYPKDSAAQGKMNTQADQLQAAANPQQQQAGGAAPATELGEDSDKHVADDHIIMGHIQRAENLGHLKVTAPDDTDVKNLDSLAENAKKLDEKLSAGALAKLKEADDLYTPHH
jgi:hypothetical protein